MVAVKPRRRARGNEWTGANLTPIAARPVAVVVCEPGEPADERMAALAAACRAQGLEVSGLIQHNEGDCALPGFSMALEDMGSGRRIPLVGEGPVPAQACRLDVAGLAEAAACLCVERHLSSDLVIINKFGRQESLGRGLRDEMAALVMAGVPLLTSVRASLLPDLEAFFGEDFVVIEPTAQAVARWLAGLKSVTGEKTGEEAAA
jgi:hypothetical protein